MRRQTSQQSLKWAAKLNAQEPSGCTTEQISVRKKKKEKSQKIKGKVKVKG